MSEDHDPRNRDLGTKLLHLLGPFALFFLAVGILYLCFDWEMFVIITSLIIAYEFPPAGKESVILTGVLALGVHWLVMAVVVAYMDIISALFLVYNFDYTKKVPLLGRWIENFEKANARALEESTWLQRGAFFGVALFVMVPFQGSGGVGGTVMGRLVGMRPWRVFLAIGVGATVSTLIYAYTAQTVGKALYTSIESTEARLAALVAFLVAITVVGSVIRHVRRKRRLAGQEGEDEPIRTDDGEE